MATLRVRGSAAAPATAECALCAHRNPDDARFCCACGAALGEQPPNAAPRRGLRIATTSDTPRALPAARWIGQAPPGGEPEPSAQHPRTLAEMLERSLAAGDVPRQLFASPRGQTCDIPVGDDAPAGTPAPQAVPPWVAGEAPAPWAPPQRASRRWRALLLVAILCVTVGVPAVLAWRDMGLLGAALTPARTTPSTAPARSANGTVSPFEGPGPTGGRPALPPAAQPSPEPLQAQPAAQAPGAVCAPQVAALGLCAAPAGGR